MTSWQPGRRRRAPLTGLVNAFRASAEGIAFPRQVAGVPLQEAIERAATAYYGGWVVDFSSDDDDRVSRLGTKTIAIPPARLVFGLGALHGRIDEKLPAERPPFPKIFTVVPSGRQDNPVARAFQSMLGDGLAPRGFMYWSIEEESGSSPSPFYMSRGLADVLGLEGKPPGLNDQ